MVRRTRAIGRSNPIKRRLCLSIYTPLGLRNEFFKFTAAGPMCRLTEVLIDRGKQGMPGSFHNLDRCLPTNSNDMNPGRSITSLCPIKFEAGFDSPQKL